MSVRDGAATMATNIAGGGGGGGSVSPNNHDSRSYLLQIYPRLAAQSTTCCNLRVHKDATVTSVISDAAAALGLDPSCRYVLAEVKESGGEEWVLEPGDQPAQRFLLWPRKAQEQHPQSLGFYFLLQEKNHDGTIHYVHLPPVTKEQEAQRLAARGFLPPPQDDFADLCNLPVLSEDSILNNLRTRFYKKKIYTYAGSILIAVNPFKFLPIYNPKYVKLYENHQLGKLEPHIFAIADVAYYAMLRKKVNQCIVISGESGSGKTQSTNFLIHCLTALSQKGYASGVERTILGAGPVLEAFGNAKTAHNNNSSRFGKFIQVNYLESGVVRGAVVEKYLLEKSRLVSREKNERNYHVFYYLLFGASEEERKEFKLLPPEEYSYLKQQNFKIEDEEDLCHDFERLQQAMEMVGFLSATKKQIFSVLSAILYLGNVTYKTKSTGRDEGLDVGPPEVLATLSELLKVKEELLIEALTKRKTVTVNDKLILPYSHSEAITARDSMAKSLYSALFDWIVLRINHALLNKKDMAESIPCLSIGVLDIFGFEDFETNSFEQFCINYANEQLQYYFNHHIFNLEQEEYQAEGITWHNIDYTDNVGCIHLISKKPTGLLYLLDEESNFPHATDETLLAKFKQQHQGNKYFVPTPVMEPAFVIQHFAGKVKYQVKDFREKNTDHMRPDIVALLRSSDRAYVRQLIGMDPVAMFRWGILRATIRGLAAFNEAGRSWAAKTSGVVRPISRTPLGELKQSNAPIDRMYKKQKNTKQRQVIPKNLLDSRSLKFIVSLTLHDRTTKSLLHLHKKKKPPSISAQFQTSLTKLLETLNKAEPFFIRCIRSNAEKKEMYLDEALVIQQLRYTGMLETVRIRRSGYGAKYTFQEFVDQFRVLLPKDTTSFKEDISELLEKKMGLDPCTYQIGKTKVFLKELERQQLQDKLHKDVMRKIIFLQRWFRAHLVCLEEYPIHTVTGLVKQWLRELPDPLMTFTHYNDFLHAVDLPEKQEQLHAIYKVLEELPPANYNTLERLIFHLVRVCKVEEHNRMSPNSLAIVFAPCVLRCPDSADPLLSMKDVRKTTMCMEMIINEQIRRYNEKKEEIEQLEYAEALAVNQLKLKRQNTVHEKVSSDLSVVPENEPLDSDTETEKNLVERIKSIKQEKEDLACRLPELEQPGSDQENMDSETSQSSESLLDELQRSSVHSLEPEGRGGALLRRHRPACPPKPADLAQRHKVPSGRVSLPNLTPASSTSSLMSSASSTSGSSRHPLQRRNPIIPDTVKLPAGVLSQSTASILQSQTPPGNRALNYFRKREQPGRRKGSTQSLYIDSPECDLLLHFSSCPPSASTSSTSISNVEPFRQDQNQETQASKDQRRFSDPDIPYTDDVV